MKHFYSTLIAFFIGLTAASAQHLQSTSYVGVADNVDFSTTYIDHPGKDSDKQNTKIVMPEAAVANTPKWRLAAFAGYGYRTAKIGENVPGVLKQYIKNLKSGYNFGGEAAYFFKPNLGIGAKYSGFKSSESMDDITATGENGQQQTGSIEDNHTIHFAAPAFYSRILSKDGKFAFLTNVSLGYLDFRNNTTVFEENFIISGGTLGIGVGAGLDVMLTKNIGLGADLSFLGGTLKKIKLDRATGEETVELDKEQYENLGRLDFSAGIRWIL